MMFKSSLAMAAAILSASVVNAHVQMVKPNPYGPIDLDNSPLHADGGDFPCKLRAHVYDDPVQPNNMIIGKTQTLELMGSAVHGGGSCQISLTTDMQPTAESEWQVIHSIEGGCPASIDGNFPDNASRKLPGFQYTIPEGISPGKYTLAWTWFNKIGNREMYMNCAPVNIQAGPSKRNSDEMQSKRETSFPSMFVANIGNGCQTIEGNDVQFENPGDSVDVLGIQKDLKTLTCGNTSPGGGSNSGSNSGSTPSKPSPAPQPEPVTTDAPATEPTDTPDAPVETTPAPAPSAPTTPETPSAPSGSGDALSGSCSTEGIWNCIGGSSFQRCASGTWSEAQPLADGTSCTAGQGAELNVAAVKRTVHRREIHSRRRSIGSQHA